MPVADHATYCQMLNRAWKGRFSYPAIKVDEEVGNKKAYDPRSYLTLAKTALAERVKQAVSELRSAGTTMMK